MTRVKLITQGLYPKAFQWLATIAFSPFSKAGRNPGACSILSVLESIPVALERFFLKKIRHAAYYLALIPNSNMQLLAQSKAISDCKCSI